MKSGSPRSLESLKSAVMLSRSLSLWDFVLFVVWERGNQGSNAHEVSTVPLSSAPALSCL